VIRNANTMRSISTVNRHTAQKKAREICIRGKKPENDPLENDLVETICFPALFASGRASLHHRPQAKA
jgi:hypothetical protein